MPLTKAARTLVAGYTDGVGPSWTAKSGIVLAILVACSGKVTTEGSSRDGAELRRQDRDPARTRGPLRRPARVRTLRPSATAKAPAAPRSARARVATAPAASATGRAAAPSGIRVRRRRRPDEHAARFRRPPPRLDLLRAGQRHDVPGGSLHLRSWLPVEHLASRARATRREHRRRSRRRCAASSGLAHRRRLGSVRQGKASHCPERSSHPTRTDQRSCRGRNRR